MNDNEVILHPLVEEFWVKAGWTLQHRGEDNTTVIRIKNNDYYESRPVATTGQLGIIYWFMDDWYMEEEVLRLIKLKAFL